jgi:hypothetical protein
VSADASGIPDGLVGKDASPVPLAGACDSTPGGDKDGDGFSILDGDCNDCDPAMNPGALDVAGNNVDEDCSGTADDEQGACDNGLPADGDALAAAKAIGLCRKAVAGAKGKARSWGLLSARYVYPDGSPASAASFSRLCGNIGSMPPNDLSHGILGAFGPNVKPRAGSALALLSSGIARPGQQMIPGQEFHNISPLQAGMCRQSNVPDGFPVSSYSTCGDLVVPPGPGPNPKDAFDSIALELVIRAPTNARAFAVDFDFYTFEYYRYVCSNFNDTFVALLFSASPDVPANHNIAFDAQNNPICVNNAFVEYCEPFVYQGMRGGAPFSRPFTCRGGTGELDGTGFELPDPGAATGPGIPVRHAATGWLQTRANIVPGEEFTLRFAVWDAGDDTLDSTVLLDHFLWDAKAGELVTVRPPDIVIP